MPHHELPTIHYDTDTVSGIDTLRERVMNADSVEDWSYILSDYVKFGNNKIANSVGIFNFNSATDCPNIGTDNCQVPKESCYAFRAEHQFPDVLPYRRRQEYVWDCLDADTFASAFNALVERKRNKVTALRFSESGDFRHRGDIIKANRIAQLVDIDVYTYSASNYLEWSEAKHFTVNRSNDLSDYGDRRFFALPKGEDLPEDTVWCPFDYYDGDDLDERPKCGECRLCINSDGPDVAIPLH